MELLGVLVLFLTVFVLPFVVACLLGSAAGERDAADMQPTNRVVGDEGSRHNAIFD